MASWKERGEVPDSDEEDDAIDSQTVSNTDDPHSEERHNGIPSPVDATQTNDHNVEEGEDSKQDELDDLPAITPLSNDDFSELSTPIHRTASHLEKSSNLDRNELGPSVSSQASQKAFKIPRLFWELEENNAIDGVDMNTSKLGSEKPASDEISRSYVQITSPTSSILSSPPGSYPSLPPNASIRDRESTLPPNGTRGPSVSSTSIERQNVAEATTYSGRSLRQRNPIQLHPYLVEQEKYRQTLKARGIAPMRIASSQDESHRRTRSPDFESQEKDSQDATETGESQPLDFNWDPLLSSSPQKASDKGDASDGGNEKAAANDNQEDTDDDEFPDIDELLSTRLLQTHSIAPARRIKSYSTKSKRNLLSKGRTPGTVESRDVFDVPASPPATSSPLRAISRNLASSTHQWRSRSPAESSLPPVSRTGLNNQEAADLPTPATSAVKPRSVLADSDSGIQTLESEQEISSSDESIQIRKVSKKIRGVLPASHIRLDYQQKKPQAPVRFRDSLSISPLRTSTRRGVALPRVPSFARNPPASTGTGLPFLFDDSDDDDDEEEDREGGIIFEDNPSSPLDSLFSQSRLGVAEEDDRIDAMHPSRKRQSRNFETQKLKRRRVGSSTLSWPSDSSTSRQSKITEHLRRPRKSASSCKSSRQVSKSGSTHRRHSNRNSLPRMPAPPRLSILDVADVSRKANGLLPRFIRIAARTARSKAGQGKQSPSRKFIRLANREDTFDAQSVLGDWKGGKINPKTDKIIYRSSVHDMGRPLREIEDNRQTKLQSPVLKTRPPPQIPNPGNVGTRRKLLVSKPRQQSMNGFIAREQATTEQNVSLRQDRTLKIREWPKNRPRYMAPAARFAQLESSDVLPTTAFRSTKKSLDALFRMTRKRPISQANLQLSRFLADEDIVRPSIEPVDLIGAVAPAVPAKSSNDHVDSRARFKKRQPQRLDASAAIYRQPSDPLILDFLVPVSTLDSAAIEGSKLVGLAKFGTKYPLNFDIFPMRPGVFFHESTFIGSGRLSEAIKHDCTINPGTIRPGTSLNFAGKTFTWGPWNEEVSSEMGVGFDWVLDQLLGQTPPPSPSSQPATGAVGIVEFVLAYVYHHLCFADTGDAMSFLGRMTEILQDVSARLEVAGEDSNHLKTKSWIEVVSMSTLLLLELLRMTRVQHEESLAYRLEDLLKKFATFCIKGLLSQGLECIRKLYDDLQYLSFRDIGIKDEEFVTQAWVILIKVFDAARIPRGSFWDVVNPVLVDTQAKNINDARMMEKVWYSMFSLLPLCEFDAFGVVIEGQRQEAKFDNWLLPQQLLKKVFALYTSNQRQSPGFNDYCRSIVSRCHYLMVEWGWWNCSTVIGTLFDFFGSHSLAHLRNEEVYTSPHFLEELDLDPYLGIESEDRCFHIFLKIVALAIKHFREAGDNKAIRNLVARLLPNHNRQYPKEESIHQRDLASLRNHHDLLCTLYWAAPIQYRPSSALIQELVVADRSHKEACLINLRAWGQLSRFVLAHDALVEASYKPLNSWYQDFFNTLVQQYLQAETETREQARTLEGGSDQIVHESQLQEVVTANRAAILTTMCTSLSDLAANVRNAGDILRLKCAFTTVSFPSLLKKEVVQSRMQTGAYIAACLRVITNYIDRAKELRKTADDGIKLAVVLRDCLSTAFPEMIRLYLEVDLSSESEEKPGVGKYCHKELITCWARYVAFVTDNLETSTADFHKYLLVGYSAVFRNRLQYLLADYHWPWFLAEVLRHKDSVDVEAHDPQGFDFEKEWLLLLTKRDASRTSECHFTAQLQKHGFSLSICIQTNWSSTKKLQRVIEYMGEHMGQIHTYLGAELKAWYASLLVDVMSSLRRELEAMCPIGPEYEAYLGSVHKVADRIKRHAGEICQLDLYFLTPSSHYRPAETDPEFYRAGILKYCQEFGRQRKAASYQLFYYLHTGWKKALVSGSMQSHIRHVNKAMKNSDFMEFLLSDFVPAIIRSGFRSTWTYDNIIWHAYLPNLADRIWRALNTDDDAEARQFFRLVINLLRMIMNCLLAQKPYEIHLRFPTFQIEERNVRTTACRFWLEITGALLNHGRRFCNVAPEDERSFEEVNEPFLLYLDRMDKLCAPEQPCENDFRIPPWPVQEGEYWATFERALEDDIQHPVGTNNRLKTIRMGGRDHRVDITEYIERMPSFRQVLQYGRIGREATIPTMQNSAIVDVFP